jgi:DNA polymerase/3'-5' exonuclease PolX
VEKVEAGDDGAVVLRLINGLRARLHCVPDVAFPVALWRVTGPEEHYAAVVDRLRAKGFSLRDDRLVDPKGKVVRDADEEVIYRSAGLEPIPLELRENTVTPNTRTVRRRSPRWPRRPASEGGLIWASPTTRSLRPTPADLLATQY